MMRAYDARTFLIVEGSTDKRVFHPLIDVSECEIFVAGCRDDAVAGLLLSKKLHLVGVLCVVDRDYDAFLQQLPSHPDLIVNDDHDLEITMVRSAAFEKVMGELGSENKIAAIIQHGKNPRDVILRAAQSYGLLRLYSLERKLGFHFERLRFRSVQRDLSIRYDDIVDELINHSCLHCHDRGTMKEVLHSWSLVEHDEWLMCYGHDVTAIIGLSLRSLFGNQNANAVQREQIETALRLAFGAEEFVGTNLYTKIKHWEDRNHPQKVLRI